VPVRVDVRDPAETLHEELVHDFILQSVRVLSAEQREVYDEVNVTPDIVLLEVVLGKALAILLEDPLLLAADEADVDLVVLNLALLVTQHCEGVDDDSVDDIYHYQRDDNEEGEVEDEILIKE